jgi:regulatory protein
MPFADSTTPPPPWAAGSSSVPDPTAPAARRAGAPPPADPESDPRTRGSEPDPLDWARQIVLRQLTAAPRSRAQLEQVLRRKDCPDDVAAAVLDRMEEVGLVDDTAYAGMLVRSQQAGRGLARRALAQELRRKGVDDETAQAALDEVDPHDEEDRAPSARREEDALDKRVDAPRADPAARGDARSQGLSLGRVDAHRARGGARGAREPARLSDRRPRGSGGPVSQGDRSRTELLAVHELELDALAQTGEQRRPVSFKDRLHQERVLVDQSQVGQCQGERDPHPRRGPRPARA